MVVEGEGSDSHPGEPDTGECPMKPGIGDSALGILKALGGACALCGLIIEYGLSEYSGIPLEGIIGCIPFCIMGWGDWCIRLR
jgi:hypothetical protein